MKKPSWEKLKTPVRFTLLTLLCFLSIRILFANFYVEGPSMEPAFLQGDKILVEKVSVALGNLDRNDVVVLRSPEISGSLLKRIVAVPGDVVEVRDNAICVNGYELPDSFTPGPDSEEPELIPANCYFVLGDNRGFSQDSRTWLNKYVPKDLIVGIPILRVWPVSRVMKSW